MVSVTLSISRAATPSSSTRREASVALPTAWPVMSLALLAFWEISEMVAVISSEAVATVPMLMENSSMAEATEFMLALISSVAAATVVDLAVMSLEAPRSWVASPSRPWEAWPS